jgi:hypothetical protein
MLGKVWGMAITLISGMINGVRIELWISFFQTYFRSFSMNRRFLLIKWQDHREMTVGTIKGLIHGSHLATEKGKIRPGYDLPKAPLPYQRIVGLVRAYWFIAQGSIWTAPVNPSPTRIRCSYLLSKFHWCAKSTGWCIQVGRCLALPKSLSVSISLAIQMPPLLNQGILYWLSLCQDWKKI